MNLNRHSRREPHLSCSSGFYHTTCYMKPWVLRAATMATAANVCMASDCRHCKGFARLQAKPLVARIHWHIGSRLFAQMDETHHLGAEIWRSIRRLDVLRKPACLFNLFD